MENAACGLLKHWRAIRGTRRPDNAEYFAERDNGGDGFVVARQLIQKGTYPLIFLLGREEDVAGDAKTNLEILKAIDIAT